MNKKTKRFMVVDVDVVYMFSVKKNTHNIKKELAFYESP